MAEVLSTEDKFFDSVSTIKLKDRPMFRTSVETLRNLGYNVSTLMSSASERKNLNLYLEKETLLLTLSEDLRSLDIFKDMTWETLSNADKNVVLGLVKDIDTLSKMDFTSDHVSANIREALDESMSVLRQVSEQMQYMAGNKSFTHDNLKDLLKQVDRGDIDYLADGAKVLIPSKEDLDIVTALKMTGIDLQFENNQWKLNRTPAEREVSFVPQKDGKPLQVFGNDNIQFLLNNYLNVPHAQRQQTVVASKLLKVYTNEYERQMTEGRTLSGLEQGIIRQDVARQRNIFALDSNEFRITKILDRDTMLRNAQKLGIVNSFESIISEAKDISKVTEDVQKIVDGVSTEPAFKSINKGLNKVVGILQHAGDNFEDLSVLEGGYVEDYLQDYDRQIEYLIRSGAEIEKIEAVKFAKAEFVENAALQQAFWQQKLLEIAAENGGNIFTQELAQSMNETMEFAIKQKDGEFVMANGETVQQFIAQKNLSNDTIQQIKNRLLNKKEASLQENKSEEKSGPADENKPKETKEVNEQEKDLEEVDSEKEQEEEEPSDNNNEKKGHIAIPAYPNIFFDYVDLVEGVDLSSDCNDVLDYSNFKLFEYMWQEGQFFDVNFKLFKESTKNPNATVEDYIEKFANAQEEPPVFNPEVVVDAYYSVNKDKVGEQQQKNIQARVDTFNKHLLMTDLMLQCFSLDEISKYDSMVDAVKQPFLKQKQQEALRELAKLEKDPVKFEEALQKAIKRHEAGIVGSVINQKWSEVSEAEKEAGSGKLLSNAVDAFLNDCEKNRKKNNQELQQDGENIVKDDAENETQNVQTPPQTFGELFPSGPNVVKFQKAMKPYSAKAIMKYFIEPLLGDINKIEIYPKKPLETFIEPNSTENSQDQENDNNIEEQLKQQANQFIAIKQRDFEASAFFPAAMMFEGIKAKSSNQPQYEHVDKLQKCFEYLSSTNDLSQDDKLGVVAPNGKDVRDELRNLALRICAGDFKNKTSKDVEACLMPILTQYGVEEQTKEDIKAAFLFMTPELLAIALEPVSVVNDGKLEIGATIPSQVITAKNDNERIIGFKNKNIFDLSKHQATLENLTDLVGTIYRTKDSESIDIRDIDRGFEVELEHKTAEFNQVKDTQEVKSMLDKLRSQAGMLHKENSDNEPIM